MHRDDFCSNIYRHNSKKLTLIASYGEIIKWETLHGMADVCRNQKVLETEAIRRYALRQNTKVSRHGEALEVNTTELIQLLERGKYGSPLVPLQLWSFTAFAI